MNFFLSNTFIVRLTSINMRGCLSAKWRKLKETWKDTEWKNSPVWRSPPPRFIRFLPAACCRATTKGRFARTPRKRWSFTTTGCRTWSCASTIRSAAKPLQENSPGSSRCRTNRTEPNGRINARVTNSNETLCCSKTSLLVPIDLATESVFQWHRQQNNQSGMNICVPVTFLLNPAETIWSLSKYNHKKVKLPL